MNVFFCINIRSDFLLALSPLFDVSRRAELFNQFCQFVLSASYGLGNVFCFRVY